MSELAEISAAVAVGALAVVLAALAAAAAATAKFSGTAEDNAPDTGVEVEAALATADGIVSDAPGARHLNRKFSDLLFFG